MRQARITLALFAGALATILSFGRAAAQQAPPSESAPAAFAQADAIFEQVSKITGLPIRAPLKKKIVEKSDIPSLIEEDLKSDYPAEELRSQDASLKAFGLVPADFDLKTFLINFYTEQAAGFYDPERKTMFIAAWVAPSLQKVVLAHELTHALQDQNFGLKNFLHETEANDDATNARAAVVEGYATAAMMQEMLPSVPLASLPSLQPFMNMAIDQNPAQYPVFFHAPFFFKFQSLFPYSQGLDFMQALLRQGGWKELNQLFAHPPVNTKEVFDPKIYLAREPQPSISLSRPPALSAKNGFTFVTANTIGEEGYYSLLGQLLTEGKAKALSPSWVGDAYLVYATPEPNYFALVSRVRWSNPEAASDFFSAYKTILGKKYPNLERDPRSGTNLLVASTERGWVALVDDGDEVRWVEGAPESQLSNLIGWLRGL